MTRLQEKESFIQELTKELTYYKTEIPKLSETLEIQKKKNDELRHKNWKAMEALTLAENNLKAHLKNSQNKSVEQQEAEWAEQLRQKDVELKQAIGERNDLVATLEEMQGLEKLKESSETQDKVKELEARLATEEGEKMMLVADRDGLLQKNSKLEAEFSTILSQVAKTELLQKEINSLKNELSTRQEQNEAMSKEVVKLNSLVKIGQASLSQEQLQVKEMEEEIEKLKVQSQNHTATNGPASESTLTESNSKEVKSPSNPVSSSELPNMEKKVKSKKKKTSNQDSVKRRKFSGWFSKKLTSRKKVKNSLSSLSETNKKD
ncbi:hypothetical protein J437_LFUL005169 [Ladona fulva]|uniref:Uncharacterized protein n=1 Tax=Ladona fulva TaxID=123851 RepID=A0A8K0KL46_LADFU|nr:hypothetical protein J437_LFUL005169 [Ladona fulva]